MKSYNKTITNSLLLYAVTDRSWLGNQTLAEQVEETLKGGTTFVQLREKTMNEYEFLKEAWEIHSLCKKYKVPFVINDNVDIAVKCNADGVHVGQEDMEAGSVRKKLGENKILGVSVQTVEQAIIAEKNGADYLGVGAVFSTSTKLDADTVSYEMLRKICKSVTIPVVAIGGIGVQNVEKLKGSGIKGIAVVSAIFAQKQIKSATEQLLQKVKEVVKD